ncbi:dual specificity phosphatase 29-like [Ctenopharyngodon idella]|uniref:dual specificity phosphatase 29-like n=1 Tax=Ctenopharyngodon idella TaxID=7959 RepID=UPI0022312E14|nr:dual specificity phosphatase 29-like [Ctenopharyngodon idella]
MHKICAFFKKLFGKDPTVPEPLCVPDASTPEPEPELDLFDSDESCDLVPSIPELEPDLDLFDSDESCDLVPSIPELEPDLDLFDSDESCDLVPIVPELEPDLDLVDSDESCVPGPSSAVPRPNASTSKQDPCFQLEKRVKACTLHYKPVTQVWNNIFIGNEETARDRMTLKELGITHILNAAAMKKKLRILLGMPWEKDVKDTVDTGGSYYRGMKIRYCGFPTTKASNISKYFLPAAKFIHKAKKNSENKVFIHCTDGVNYAPTLFLAYLMIHQNMTVEDAIDYLVKVKYIEPDIDLLRQLAILNLKLVHK